jgi:hypothetical protein
MLSRFELAAAMTGAWAAAPMRARPFMIARSADE